MKTRSLFLGFIFLLTLGLFSSCTKTDRPARLSLDAAELVFDNVIQERQFNVVNVGDRILTANVTTSVSWLTVTPSSVNLSYAQTSVVQVMVHPEMLDGYGTYTGYVTVSSNGGDYSVPVTFYYDPPQDAQVALDLDYLKFSSSTTQDYFTLYNDGSQNLTFNVSSVASWLSFSLVNGEIGPGGEQKVYVDVDRTGLAPGSYAAQVTIQSNGGNAVINVDMDVDVYTVTFFNPVYTPITINVDGFNATTIDVGDRVNFSFTANPSSVHYTASTKGETTDGYQLGIEILWEETIDVSGYDSPTFNLNVNSDYFFMAVKNIGTYNLDTWSINNGTEYQIDDDFTIPNDGVEYQVAYYEALDDTEIYARLVGTADDAVWGQGIEFNFPWIENQYILLTNNFKKSTTVRPNLKSSQTQPMQLKAFVKPIQKAKGSIDLYNKK